MRKVRSLRSGFAFLIAAAGLGCAGYAGLLWLELPHYSERDIEASTELNLRMDLAHRATETILDDEALAQLRAQIRKDIERDIEAEMEGPRRWALIALITLAFSAMLAGVNRLANQ